MTRDREPWWRRILQLVRALAPARADDEYWHPEPRPSTKIHDRIEEDREKGRSRP